MIPGKIYFTEGLHSTLSFENSEGLFLYRPDSLLIPYVHVRTSPLSIYNRETS